MVAYVACQIWLSLGTMDQIMELQPLWCYVGVLNRSDGKPSRSDQYPSNRKRNTSTVTTTTGKDINPLKKRLVGKKQKERIQDGGNEEREAGEESHRNTL